MGIRTAAKSAIKLSDATLEELPDWVPTPAYDRSKLSPGIVHIGLGNFHRAHQAWYLHRLMQQGLAHDWAIIGAGVRPGDAKMRERLLAQDCLTTLVELDPDSTSVEVIGSMIDFLEIQTENAPLISAMSDPRIRIVSLTVTEGGYYQAEAGGLDTNHPDIVHDVAFPDRPVTAFGAMVAAWQVGQADRLAQLLNEEEDDPKLRKVLLTGRNKAWAKWLRARLKQPGTVFVAVGAGHLAGKGSVQDQLARRGIKASRVQ